MTLTMWEIEEMAQEIAASAIKADRNKRHD